LTNGKEVLSLEQNAGGKMSKQQDSVVKNILSFSASKPYFGRLSSSDLNDAWHQIAKSAKWDNPIESVEIKTGSIDMGVISDSLAKEMSYNPLRWGESPIVGRDLFRFCLDRVVHDAELAPVKSNLKQFFDLTANSSRQWIDYDISSDGYLKIERNCEGHPNKNYKKLRLLFNCVKIIAKRNVNDFFDKKKPYRNEIISCLEQMSLIKLSDFGLVYDIPPHSGYQPELFEKPKLISVKEWNSQYLVPVYDLKFAGR
jgi:hypothetical protein